MKSENEELSFIIEEHSTEGPGREVLNDSKNDEGDDEDDDNKYSR